MDIGAVVAGLEAEGHVRGGKGGAQRAVARGALRVEAGTRERGWLGQGKGRLSKLFVVQRTTQPGVPPTTRLYYTKG